MKVIDFLEKANKTLFSYEIIPPNRGGSIDKIFNLVEELMPFDPPFIDLTSRSAEVYYEDAGDGKVIRFIRRKRPGTIGISAAIKNKFNVETVPHILCRGFTREETEDALIELNYLGIKNVLAVRGDELRKDPPNAPGKTKHKFAAGLVEQIKEMNEGHYVEELLDAAPTDFCIGVGAYPEKHFEAPNMSTDIKYLKAKVDAGADYIVTQMFYNNDAFFKFRDDCHAAGIDIPIIPGLKILSTEAHLRVIPKNFYVDIPEELSNQVIGQSKEEIRRIGIDWAMNQVQELVDAKVPCVHFYIMSSANSVAKVVSQFN
ncbi:MAG: methylenetetrahydrofolate reductase [NAD(P)H] [Candidatus Marinimicrobia bacterium]|jgi:methylenetetrahydrofolate reductase (NADPH)|nr:methylenetetrahydrofolate reductase [NAD(P)H] [Candidatus Neomarinimicrobiota bacterium]MBT3676217.1 methylenetetrahydrofolate reductase [NAD(P)H] [Candidatus Neomarinimicrobiota bacterium]MBT3763100.1 methylenetetrahydrofolate reductase [NAD(P)H] [Candidatus Neomarinimicrobiota bacterium]MBT4067394.1 methylenetetrahydrofolate reductase [NAD(P)H] [Candidatus Neomarinimicrobiota bacterium]MBT4270873.1 methylenetetrahydrofolate reductase [NAD(P)H] [Candidatus Neomarinimicrobiota bacterium]